MDAQFIVWHHLRHVNLVDHSQALASWTSTFGRVKRKHVWGWVAIGNSSNGVHEFLREVANLSAILIQNHHGAFALSEGSLNGLGKSLVVSLLHLHLVNHHLDIVVLVAVNLHSLNQVFNLSIHPCV